MRGSGTIDSVAATRVAQAEVVDQARSEGVGLVEDSLLAEDMGETDHSTGADDRAGNRSAALGERRDWLLNVGEVGVTGKASVV